MIALVLLVAGHETTVNAIALGALTLMQHPEQIDVLLSDPDAVPRAVEELLRFTSVSDYLVRMATQEIEVGGETIRAGDAVLVSITLMNRDAGAYEDPDVFDARRNARHHVASATASTSASGRTSPAPSWRSPWARSSPASPACGRPCPGRGAHQGRPRRPGPDRTPRHLVTGHASAAERKERPTPCASPSTATGASAPASAS